MLETTIHEHNAQVLDYGLQITDVSYTIHQAYRSSALPVIIINIIVDKNFQCVAHDGGRDTTLETQTAVNENPVRVS